MLLSIIIPFYNSKQKCTNLTEKIKQIHDSEVEVVLIDDGSTDETFEHLKDIQKESPCKVIVDRQENKGPGGARNHGLSLSTGEYIWFVDSDDDINLSAIEVLKKLQDKKYDFIDFDLKSKAGQINSMNLPAGEHTTNNQTRTALLKNFGRIWSKIIRKEIIIKNNILYPEFCIYEDNPLSLIYPLTIKRFYKTNSIGYYYNEENESITRGSISPRFFDRLETAIFGIKKALKLTSTEEEKNLAIARFTDLFLINTTITLMSQKNISGIIDSARVMRHYRDSIKKINTTHKPIEIKIDTSKRKLLALYKIAFRVIWLASYIVPNQDSYFSKKHLSCWQQPIFFPEKLTESS